VNDLVELLLDGRDHPRVAMAGIVDGDSGEAIDVLRAVRVPDPGALGPLDDHRLK
jgi:hypothetical protein